MCNITIKIAVQSAKDDNSLLLWESMWSEGKHIGQKYVFLCVSISTAGKLRALKNSSHRGS